MSKIRVLSEHLCNIIAAGEVVDRPAAIVKELVENSLDANAKQITVKIQNGGLDEIFVSDDGDGMNKEDLQLAFLSHSTSKISKENDLNNLKTLGFRGEALAAIGSLSNCEIVTNDGEKGFSITNLFGEITKAIPKARNKGTTVSVKELFYQNSQRFKFLKSSGYESALIGDLMQKFALSYPNISFRYFNNARLIFNSLGNNDLNKLLFTVYGPEIHSHFLKLKITDYDFKIEGYITDSHYNKSSKNGINFFLNKRLVNNNALTKALVSAYSDHLPSGRYPLAIIHIDLDPVLMDVNISPTKWQIRISKEKGLLDLLQKGIKETLWQKNQAAIISSFPLDVVPETKKDEKNPIVYQQLQLEQSPVIKEDTTVIVHQPKVIGQAFGKFIIADFQDELWLIDQHAAQERCNYEKFKKALTKTKSPLQIIDLPPLTVSLAHMSQLSLINERLEAINLHFEEYGNNKLLIRSLPLWITQVDIEAFLLDILDSALEEKSADIQEIRKAALASLACHSSIKFNEHLSYSAQQSLVSELLNCENPYHCPHGRPTIVKLTEKQLSKEFLRG